MPALDTPTGLSTLRQGIGDIVAQVTDRVYAYVPDDVSELPCVVVGPFTLDRNAQVGGWSATVPVLCIGRRIGTFDSQQELEELVWATTMALEGSTSNPDVPGCRPGRVSPELQTVAGSEYPAYEITVRAEAIYC